MRGLTLVTEVSLNNIHRFRTLGMGGGFGQDQPLCDFIATERWTNKRGTSIAKGETIKIGKVTLIETPDGYGNTGTKLILDSAEPKEGLVFYCYAYNREEGSYWAINKDELRAALKGYFRIAD